MHQVPVNPEFIYKQPYNLIHINANFYPTLWNKPKDGYNKKNL